MSASACIVIASVLSSGLSLEDVIARVEDAKSSYDVEKAEDFLPGIQAFVERSDSEESRLALGQLTVVICELLRLEYEKNDGMSAKKRRQLGRRIDDFAQVGLEYLNGADDSSEKFRMKSDLYATMIRSKYQGKKYADNMERNAERAVEEDPENPDAWITLSKKLVFAKEKHGGNLEEGLAMLNRALELAPNSERALIFRGLAYEKMDELRKATADWQKAIGLNPDCRPAVFNIERIKDPR